MRKRLDAVANLVTMTALFTMAAVGCGKSGHTPTGPTAQSTAFHFDSLYVQAILAGTPGDSLRASLLTFLEIAAAGGGIPAPVTVTTDSGTDKWQALSLQVGDTSGSATAAIRTVTVVYSDANVTNAALLQVTTGFGAQVQAEMVATDTIDVRPSSATGLATETSGAACKTLTGLSNPIFSTLSGFHCTQATFESSMSADFPSTAGVDPSLTHVSFASLTSTGVRYTNATP